MTPNQCRALAIVAMGPARHEYNLGVLSMMGQADLATVHRLAYMTVESAHDALEAEQAHNPCDGSFAGVLASSTPRSARQIALQAQLDAALLRRNAAWSHIEHIIEQHQGIADAAMVDWQP